MIRYRKHTLPIIALAVAVMISLLFIPVEDKDAASDRDARNPIVLTKALYETIRTAKNNYYEEIDQDKMYEGAIKGALAALDDPYCFYLSSRDLKRESENLYHGRFGGLGIHIYADKGFIKIARPLPNTPAMKAGLQAGDYIIKVNGDPINIGPSGQTLYDVVDILRGEVGTQVTITVTRRGNSEPFDVTLTREEIKPNSVEKTMLEDGIGYISVRQFTGRTGEEFTNALTELQNVEAGEMKSLILDLRYNPGGLLDSAYAVADAFISEGIVVSTKGRKHKFNREYHATRDVFFPPEIDLVILVNEYSASGSEIVAGAIKDSKRGILVGIKTFGKGVVLQRFPLEHGGGAISLTISTHYTPSGVSINKKGIMPHIVVKPEELETAAFVMRQKMGEGKHVNTFVEKWIEEEEQRTGETPKAFSKLEAELPKLVEVLAENDITIDLELVKIEARRVFNANVGIAQIVDLEHDNQLQEAIRIIKAGEVEKILASATAVTDL